MFEGGDVDYCQQGMFFVSPVVEDSKKKKGYSLYNEEEKLTEPIFKTNISSKFNEHGFAVVSYFDTFENAILNKRGEIILNSKSYHHPYIYGVVCSSGSEYINLLTGETICKSGYSTIYSTDFIFCKVEENCVYQIEKSTGKSTIHGVAPKPKPEPAPAPYVKPIEKPKVVEKRQNRNDMCACKSGKKFKNCCIDKTKNHD